MITTNHCLARMSQRGLPKQLLDLVLEFGKDKNDKVILDKKTTQKVINELDKLRSNLLKVKDKGGVTVVIDNDILVTAYNTNINKY